MSRRLALLPDGTWGRSFDHRNNILDRFRGNEPVGGRGQAGVVKSTLELATSPAVFLIETARV